MVITSKNLNQTGMAAEQFLDILTKKDFSIVSLHGDLGSGKTTFTQAVAEALSIEEKVTSPTFVIQKRYKLPKAIGRFEQLIHIDAYRLDKASELEVLGWKEIVSDPANLIMLEWPERVAEIIPPNALRLNFTFIDEETRQIEIDV
jgi:tRNA threonylcarbamoyladenosine biosynthesis protein TsaE